MPRQKKRLTEEQLAMCHKMAALRMPHEYMAALLNVPKDTFLDWVRNNKVLRATLSAGRSSANHNVRVTLFEKAMGKPAVIDEDRKVIAPAVEPDIHALKFWCETQEGFKKTSVIELPGLTEEDTSGLKDDDLDGRAEKLLEKIRARRAKGYGKSGKQA